LIFFKLEKQFSGLGKPLGYVGTFPTKEGDKQVLAGLAPSSQTVGSLSRTPNGNFLQIVCSAKSIDWKNRGNYFLSKAFYKFKKLTNLCTFQINDGLSYV